jgi:hypothetical protein
LSAVESINYMLLQSWDGAIQVFPATPARWKNVHFRQFRTEEAFLVSASRVDGVTKDSVLIRSEKGKPCVVVNPWAGQILHVVGRDGRGVATTRKGERYSFPTKAGEAYVLTTKAPTSVAIVESATRKMQVRGRRVIVPGVEGVVVECDAAGQVLARYPILDGEATLLGSGRGVRILRVESTDGGFHTVRAVVP